MASLDKSAAPIRAPSNKSEIASNGSRYLLKSRVPIAPTVPEGSEESVKSQGVLDITIEMSIMNHNATTAPTPC